MLLACLLAAALPQAVSPEAEGVSSRQIMAWLDTCERDIDAVHGFVLLRHGKVVAEGSWKPFDTLDEPHRLSSHSKCFVSTAAGILVDEAKLDVDELVVDILPDKVPAGPSENLRHLRVRDLMTMTAGLKPGYGFHTGDWARQILAKPADHKPGQVYAYDSDATHLLGVIVARKSGLPLEEFLRKRLFEPLGITSFWTTYDQDGIPCAGYGFNMSTRDIARIGQLHLDKGLWEGRRIVSREWTELASAKHTWSGKTASEWQADNDWVQGFGFNFWRCQHGCYRADGAGGQFTIVMPDQDAVLSLNSAVGDMQQLLTSVWTHVLPALSKTALPEDPASAAALKARCAKLAFAPARGRRDGDARYQGRTYSFKSAPLGIRSVRLEPSSDGWELTLVTESGSFAVPVGYGKWMRGEAVFSPHTYEYLGEVIGKQPLAASAAVREDGSLAVRVQMLQGLRAFDWRIRKKLFRTAVDCTRGSWTATSGME